MTIYLPTFIVERALQDTCMTGKETKAKGSFNVQGASVYAYYYIIIVLVLMKRPIEYNITLCQVVDMRSLMKEEDEVPSPLLDNNEKHSDVLPRYHVMGPINSVYSELVINRMCT